MTKKPKASSLGHRTIKRSVRHGTKKSGLSEEEAIERLSGLALNERLQAVADDVESRRDEFRAIAPHALADLLGVPNAEHPGPDWSYTSYVKREPLAEYVQRSSPAYEVIYRLEGKVSKARFNKLKSEAKLMDRGVKKFKLSLLSAKEQTLIENHIMEEGIHEPGTPLVIGNYSLEIPGRKGELSFEGDIEESDGDCIDLRTPYDERDGLFVDLTDSATEIYTKPKKHAISALSRWNCLRYRQYLPGQ